MVEFIPKLKLKLLKRILTCLSKGVIYSSNDSEVSGEFIPKLKLKLSGPLEFSQRDNSENSVPEIALQFLGAKRGKFS